MSEGFSQFQCIRLVREAPKTRLTRLSRHQDQDVEAVLHFSSSEEDKAWKRQTAIMEIHLRASPSTTYWQLITTKFQEAYEEERSREPYLHFLTFIIV